MIKKTKPNVLDVMLHIKIFPHCDPRILHAPGECEFCDKHSDWQALRQIWGITFTGYEPEGKELPDPATHIRGFDNANAWCGNKAKSRLIASGGDGRCQYIRDIDTPGAQELWQCYLSNGHTGDHEPESGPGWA